MSRPGLIGVFVERALVARELESGTFRLRGRWPAAGSSGSSANSSSSRSAHTFALAFSALFTWWYGPFDAITAGSPPYGAYEMSAAVFAAGTLFGFTLGVLFGLLIRRTVPAMAATAAVWVAVVVPSDGLAAAPDPETDHRHRYRRKGANRQAQPVPLNATGVDHWFQDTPPATTSASTSSSPQARAGNGRTSPTPDQF